MKLLADEPGACKLCIFLSSFSFSFASKIDDLKRVFIGYIAVKASLNVNKGFIA